HRATIEKHGDNWIRPENFVGNGAYRIAERVLNEKLVFERNPHYWNDKETVINRATIYVLNESAGIARYRSGELDIANIPAT
ncbi:ABC transporter substrate-binding protein, partial [Glaesserella parasuis]